MFVLVVVLSDDLVLFLQIMCEMTSCVSVFSSSIRVTVDSLDRLWGFNVVVK